VIDPSNHQSPIIFTHDGIEFVDSAVTELFDNATTKLNEISRMKQYRRNIEICSSCFY
jgi:hypothetical protein